MIGEQLKIAARFVQTHASAQDDLHAVARFETHGAVAIGEHRAANLRAVVLQREVPVAAARRA